MKLVGVNGRFSRHQRVDLGLFGVRGELQWGLLIFFGEIRMLGSAVSVPHVRDFDDF
jgi:hypothetical protein